MTLMASPTPHAFNPSLCTNESLIFNSYYFIDLILQPFKSPDERTAKLLDYKYTSSILEKMLALHSTPELDRVKSRDGLYAVPWSLNPSDADLNIENNVFTPSRNSNRSHWNRMSVKQQMELLEFEQLEKKVLDSLKTTQNKISVDPIEDSLQKIIETGSQSGNQSELEEMNDSINSQDLVLEIEQAHQENTTINSQNNQRAIYQPYKYKDHLHFDDGATESKTKPITFENLIQDSVSYL